MSKPFEVLCRLRSGSPYIVGILLVATLMPGRALAHWSICVDDPKVWLDNGVQVSVATAVSADPSLVAHLSFTLHVPAGTNLTRIVYTSGKDSSFETVSVVQDSPGGYSVDALAQSTDGGSYSVNLSAHRINHGSAWSSANGATNQTLTSWLPGP